MKYLLYFLLIGFAWVVGLLTWNPDADVPKVFAVSAISSFISLLLFALLRKPLRKWYLRNFDKTYMMSRGYKNGRKIK